MLRRVQRDFADQGKPVAGVTAQITKVCALSLFCVLQFISFEHLGIHQPSCLYGCIGAAGARAAALGPAAAHRGRAAAGGGACAGSGGRFPADAGLAAGRARAAVRPAAAHREGSQHCGGGSLAECRVPRQHQMKWLSHRISACSVSGASFK